MKDVRRKQQKMKSKNESSLLQGTFVIWIWGWYIVTFDNMGQ